MSEHIPDLATIEADAQRLAIVLRNAVLSADDADDMPVQATIGACFWLARQLIELGYATARCKELGMQVGRVPDERWGSVGSYPVEVLDELWTERNGTA